MQYFVNEGTLLKSSIMEGGTVHIIICNPRREEKKSCTRITFIADEQDGWEVSGDTDVQ